MENACTLTVDGTESGYVCRIEGRGTMGESPHVRDFICGAIADGAHVVLDLSTCEYLDSTFLGCLVMLHARGENQDGSFRIFADPSRREKLLGTVHLDHYLNFTDECPAGTGDPVTLDVSVLDRAEFGEHLLETHRKLAELGGPAAGTFQKVADQIARELGA